MGSWPASILIAVVIFISSSVPLTLLRKSRVSLDVKREEKGRISIEASILVVAEAAPKKSVYSENLT